MLRVLKDEWGVGGNGGGEYHSKENNKTKALQSTDYLILRRLERLLRCMRQTSDKDCLQEVKLTGSIHNPLGSEGMGVF